MRQEAVTGHDTLSRLKEKSVCALPGNVVGDIGRRPGHCAEFTPYLCRTCPIRSLQPVGQFSLSARAFSIVVGSSQYALTVFGVLIPDFVVGRIPLK